MQSSLKLLIRALVIGVCVAASLTSSRAQQATFEGSWSGRLVLPKGMSLKIVFHLQPSEEGWTGTMDSPDQGAYDIPISKVEIVDPDGLLIKSDALYLSYEGKLVADSIVGSFKQGMAEIPLVMHRGGKSLKARHQEPKRPYPYDEEELSIYNRSAQIHLAATLTKKSSPSAKKQRAIILVTGSGPQDRDETIMGHKPFLVLADALTRQGYMVLRADDRGVGKSEGDFATATCYDFLSDLAAAIDYLSKRPDVEPGIIVLGHSEGALLAMMSAYQDTRISDIVLLGAPAVKGSELLLEQNKMLMPLEPEKEELNAGCLQMIEQVIAVAADSTLADSLASRQIKAILDAGSMECYGIPTSNAGTLAQVKAQIAKQMLTPWMRTYLGIVPPMKSLAEGRSYRVLAIYGGLDKQVSPSQNAHRMGELLEIATNPKPKAKLLIFEDLNHLMQKAETGYPGEYAQIEETINPLVIEAIIKFLKGK